MAKNKDLNIRVRAKGTKRATKAVRGLSGAFTGMAASAAAAFAPIIMIGAAYKAIAGAINVGKEFEQSMANLKAISGATGKDFADLENMAKRLGASTKFTASEVAGLSTEFAKLGFSSKEIQAVSNDTLALAAATGAELPRAAEVAGATLRGFGIQASDTQRVTNLMAASFSGSALDMSKFAESMKFVAPVARSAGFQIEGTTAMLAKLADVGIHGSMAGTAMKSLFLKMADSGSALSKALGGPVTNMEELIPKLRELKAAGLELPDALALTDKRSAAAFLTLVEGSDDLEALTKSFTGTTAATEMMAIQLDTLEGRTAIAKSATQGFAIELFDVSEGPLKSIVEGFTVFMNTLTDVTVFLKQIDWGKSFSNLVNMLPALATAVSKTFGAMFDFLPDHLKTIGNKIFKIWHKVANKIIDVVFSIAETIWEPIPIAANIMSKKIQKFFTIMGARIKNIITPAINFIKEEFNTLADTWVGAKLGLEPLETTKLIDVEGLGEQFDSQIIALQESLKDTEMADLIGNMFVNSDDIQTQQQYLDALAEIWAEYGKKVVAVEENIKEEIGEDDDGKAKKPGTLTATETESQLQYIDDIATKWITSSGEMKTRTIDQNKAIENQGRLFVRNMNVIGKEFPAAAKVAKRFAQVQATVDAIAAANAAYKAMAGIPIVGPGLGIAAAGAALAAGYANVRKIEAAATGYDDVVNSPTMFLAGEAGRERVSITPLEGPNINGPQGASVTVNFSGNVMSQDFIEDEAIPMIKEAIRRGSDIGIS